jgi:hypothetical protein
MRCRTNEALVTALLIGSTIHGALVTALFIGSTMRKVPFVITPILRCIIRFRRQYIGLQLTLSIIPTSRLTTIKQACSGHRIMKEMFYIPIKLKPELARASMTMSDVNNQWRSN